jgi:PPOX class probable F420-dependent enzyme
MAMTVAEAFTLVAANTQGVLVTLKQDGRPQLSNIIYATGPDHAVRISVTDERAKTNNLRRDPRASLHVTRQDFYAYVVLEGTVALSPVAGAPDDAVVDELVDMYRALSGEHPDWDEYRSAMVAQGRVVATLAAERAYGMLSA